MKKILGILLIVAPLASVLAIDFTPRYATSVQDGFPVRRLYFSDQAQRIYLSVPRSWYITGSAQRATWTPKEPTQASVILENSPIAAQIAFDEKGLELYRQAAASLIPAGADQLKIDFERVNEIETNGWTSFEQAFTYMYYGQSFSKSVLFVTLSKEQQIRLRVESRSEGFEKLYPQARAALGSWFAPSPELEAALEHLSKN